MMLKIEDLRRLCSDINIRETKHARHRLRSRGLRLSDIKNAIMNGEIIEQYESSEPAASCLVLGLDTKKVNIHVVVSIHKEKLCIITAYCPDPLR